ncbi:MAG TPA: hypothetical protein VLF69_04925 [Candidatus Saccharimonadales bacterium]|nr:hypothetical protein [Candidatus Saccharimonadales bacterium]
MLDLSCLPGRVVNARDRLVSLVVAAAVPWPERMYEQEGPAVSLVEHVHRRAVVLANEDLRNLGQAFQFGWVAADVPPAGDYTPEDNFFDD